MVRRPKRQEVSKMKQTVGEFVEVPGHVVLIETKTKTQGEWIKQARDAMDRAGKYGAKTPNEMKTEDRDLLREALKALGQNPLF